MNPEPEAPAKKPRAKSATREAPVLTTRADARPPVEGSKAEAARGEPRFETVKAPTAPAAPARAAPSPAPAPALRGTAPEHDAPLQPGSRILEAPTQRAAPLPTAAAPPALAKEEREAHSRIAKDLDKLDRLEKARQKREAAADRKRRRKEGAGKAKVADLQERLERHLVLVAGRARRVGYTEREVLEIPEPAAGTRIVEMQEIVPGRAFVRMLYEEETHTHLYQVLEPVLTPLERQILDFIRDTLLRTLEGPQSAFSKDQAQATLLAGARQAILDHAIIVDRTGLERIEYHLVRDFLGYGPVDVLMRDPMIEDISCDGPGIPIYLFHRRHESLRTNVVFGDDLTLDAFVIRLAQRSGKHISIAEPLLDATLPDGSRLQATLAREVTTRGSSFTVRKFRADPMTPPDLVRLGTLSAEMAAYMWMVIEHGHSFILAGGTASGKTTSLNAICQFIPPAKKIVSIEDTREINLSHDNWIAGLTRAGFGGQLIGGKPAGTIDMYRLLEAALRQRPEYLLVGEVRGPEALTLFQAMATGHAVYSTMHADSVPSAVYRLENPPINVPRIMLQTLDVVAIQTQQRVKGRMARRLREVVEVVGVEPGTMELLTNTVFAWDSKNDRHRFLGKSHVFEVIMDRRNLSEAEVAGEWRRRIELIEWMVREKVPDYRAVAALVASYYRDAPALLARVRAAKPGGA